MGTVTMESVMATYLLILGVPRLCLTSIIILKHGWGIVKEAGIGKTVVGYIEALLITAFAIVALAT